MTTLEEATLTELLTALQLKLEYEGEKGYDRLPLVAAEISGQINLGEIILKRLWGRRNAVQAINQLPPETLILIFSMVRNFDFDVFPPRMEGELTGMNDWIVITQVCRLWRTIALNDRRLWSNIVLGSRVQNQELVFLERIGPYIPFHLNLSIPPPLSPFDSHSSRRLTSPLGLRQVLHDNAERVQSLHISRAGFFSTELWPVLDQPLPALQSLHLSLMRENVASTAGQGIPLPRILRGQQSRLTHLSLARVTHWPENKTTFSRITHLALMNQDSNSRLRFYSFLLVLEGLPLLEVLGLYFAGPQACPNDGKPRAKTLLPCIRRIEFEWSDAQLSPCRLLDFIDWSNKKLLEIIFRGKGTMGGPGNVTMSHSLPPPELLLTVSRFSIQNDSDPRVHGMHLTTSTLPNAPGGLLEIIIFSKNRDETLNAVAPLLPNIHDVRVCVPPSLSTRRKSSSRKIRTDGNVIRMLHRFPKLTHARLEYALNYPEFVAILGKYPYQGPATFAPSTVASYPQREERPTTLFAWPHLKQLTVHELPKRHMHETQSIQQQDKKVKGPSAELLREAARKSLVESGEEGDVRVIRHSATVSHDGDIARRSLPDIHSSARSRGQSEDEENGRTFALVILPRSVDGSLKVKMSTFGRNLPYIA